MSPSMPPRRTHTKSRAGCKRCKLRKIKCDEVHPKCGKCVKHGVSCDFGNPEIIKELLASAPSHHRLSSPESPTSTSPTTNVTPCSPGPPRSPLSPTSAALQLAYPYPFYKPSDLVLSPNGSGAGGDRMLELRLMHQYTTLTSKTVTVNNIGDVWSNDVPKLAFDGAPYLADAMLAAAALHLRALDPEDQTLVEASHSYMASSLAKYCQELNAGINQFNAEALFLTSSLIAFQSTASRVFARDDPGADPSDASSVYTLPLSWFHAFQGVKAVVASTWPYLRNSSIVRTVIDAQPALQLDVMSSSAFFGSLLDDLEDELASEEEAHREATQEAYHHATSVLNWAHSSPARGAALSFPATTSKRFVELIEMRRPRALTLLACFFALLRRVDSIWWLEGVPRREIIGIASLFDQSSPWWRRLQWPLRIALYEDPVIPPDIWGADWMAEENRVQKKASNTTYVQHIEALCDMLTSVETLPTVPPMTPVSMVSKGSPP